MRLSARNYASVFLSAVTILLSGGLQSCSDETFTTGPDPVKPVGDGAKRYFSMQLITPDAETLEPGDKDFGFADGTDFEHAMDVTGQSENVVIMFNDDMTFYGYTTIDYDGLYSQGGSVNFPSEVSYIGVIHSPDPEVLYALPEYGLVVLNAHNITGALDRLADKPDACIADVLALTDEASEGRRPGMSGSYHTMTSTAYLEPDGTGWRHSILFKLDKSKIYDNRMQAVVTPAATAVVERMGAKFSLSLPGADGGKGLQFTPDNGRAQVIVCHYTDGQPNYNNRTWTCTVDAWGINKYETSEYYFRNIIGDGADTSVYPFTYPGDINTTGHPFYNGWNRPSYRRALWGADPHYNNGVYPRQFRPAVDNPEMDWYGSHGAPSLGYVSYNELSTDFSGLSSKTGVNLYSSENTFPDTRVGALWQHDLGASEVIVGARIHINRVDESKADYDLYRNRIGVFYPSVTDFATYFIQTVNNQLASQATMTYRFYDWDNPASNSSAEIRTVKIEHPNCKLYYGKDPLTPEKMAAMQKWTIPATIEFGDGKVIPWVQGIYIGWREVDPNTYEEVGDVFRISMAENELKSLIYDWIGSFDHFNGGRMVYAVPVLHKASVDKVSQQGYRPTVGDYGVARNTWYSFAVQSINSLGDPIDDLDQKIILYETSLENSIMTELKVIDWHEFSTGVTLPGTLK